MVIHKVPLKQSTLT